MYRSLLWKFLCDKELRPKLTMLQEEEEELVFEYDRQHWSFHVKVCGLQVPLEAVCLMFLSRVNLVMGSQ